MDVRIEDAKLVQDAMVCTIVLGEDDGQGGFAGLVSVKDVWVRYTKDKTRLWFKYPEKVRMRNGQQVIGDDGYPVRDPLVDTYTQDGRPTKQAFAFKDRVTEAITATYHALSGTQAGRGSTGKPQPRTAPAPAAMQRKVGAAPAAAKRAPQPLPDAGDDEGEDLLPF